MKNPPVDGLFEIIPFGWVKWEDEGFDSGATLADKGEVPEWLSSGHCFSSDWRGGASKISSVLALAVRSFDVSDGGRRGSIGWIS